MAFKFILNILYNICIIICAVVIYFGFHNHNYAYVLAGFFLGALVLIFKLRLIKDIKKMTKKP